MTDRAARGVEDFAVALPEMIVGSLLSRRPEERALSALKAVA